MEAITKKPNGQELVGEIVKAEVVPQLPQTQVRLGSLSIQNPKDVILRGTEFATSLAEIINQQKLYTLIQGKKYVQYEGWVTLGALLGVMPEEEYCRPIENGYEAKVRLIRTSDGQICGAASAECTREESSWKGRNSYALRSMAITRATGKAFRLSFSWIMKLAGFSPTPAEEMVSSESDHAKEQIEAEIESQKRGNAPSKHGDGDDNHTGDVDILFYVRPSAFNGHRTEFVNLEAYGKSLNSVAQQGLKLLLEKHVKKGKDGLWIPTDKWPALEAELKGCGVTLSELKPR